MESLARERDREPEIDHSRHAVVAPDDVLRLRPGERVTGGLVRRGHARDSVAVTAGRVAIRENRPWRFPSYGRTALRSSQLPVASIKPPAQIQQSRGAACHVPTKLTDNPIPDAQTDPERRRVSNRSDHARESASTAIRRSSGRAGFCCNARRLFEGPRRAFTQQGRGGIRPVPFAGAGA